MSTGGGGKTSGGCGGRGGGGSATHLYAQEINGETYAICTADLLLKGEGHEADNIVRGLIDSSHSIQKWPATLTASVFLGSDRTCTGRGTEANDG